MDHLAKNPVPNFRAKSFMRNKVHTPAGQILHFQLQVHKVGKIGGPSNLTRTSRSLSGWSSFLATDPKIPISRTRNLSDQDFRFLENRSMVFSRFMAHVME